MPKLSQQDIDDIFFGERFILNTTEKNPPATQKLTVKTKYDMKKRILLCVMLGSCFVVLLIAGQCMRWRRLSPPQASVTEYQSGYIDYTQLCNRKNFSGIVNKAFDPESKAGLNPDWNYFYTVSVQETSSRGVFPFVHTKTDTLSVTLNKSVR